MLMPDLVRSKTALPKSLLEDSDENYLQRYHTADFKGKLVNDIEEFVAKGDAETKGVRLYCETLLKQYRTSRAEDVRVTLGAFNLRGEENVGDSVQERGPVLMSDFAVYVGTWSLSGKRHGVGLCYLPDGSIYEGMWTANLPNGHGRLVFSSCDYFEGHFELGVICGNGRLNRNDQSYYEGNWMNNLPHGEGVEGWADGQLYEGGYRYGKKHGTGRFIWEAASYYEGEFVENFMEGKGVCVWSNNRKYSGEWRKNAMHGQGRFETSDGRVYQGEYVDGQKEGRGVYTWANGRRYEGEWKKGQQHGIGKMFEPGSTVGVEGIWENGKRMV
jgi:hypothetical protein